MTSYWKNRYPDTSYEYLMEKILETGSYRSDRTGVGTMSTFGESLEYNMRNGFPLITTKNVHFKSVVGELLWFLSGSTDKNELEEEYGVTIWREWGAPAPRFNGDLGPIYSEQWRNGLWAKVPADRFSPAGVRSVDQIKNVVEGIKSNPFGRRHIVNAWNVGQIDDMALPPCHMMFQFWVNSNADGQPSGLSLQMYQRSADMFLGVPFNIASYALLLEMVAAQVGLPAERLHIAFGDAHIYRNHVEQVELQVRRAARPFPTLALEESASIFDYTPEMIKLEGYDPHPRISAEVAV